MFKELIVHANFNERTGYGIHASRFFPKLDALVRNARGTHGTVHISMIDSVGIQNVNERHPYPSILYNVWESTEQPQWFIDKLRFFDQLWVASEWQRAASIAQGIPEEFVKVVPEGVSPDIYKPQDCPPEYKGLFNFVYVGQWQPRKSTLEVCKAFIAAFPNNPDVRLHLSADTLFPSDNFKSTEERLEAYGIKDSRIIPVHFEEREEYIRRLQGAHCFVSCARSEGWGLPIIEAMACGIPTIVADWSGSTEYAHDAIRVPITKLIKPFGIYGNWEVPGQWCEPDFKMLESRMQYVVEKYDYEKKRALETSDKIRTEFSWDAAAEKAMKHLQELHATIAPQVEKRKEISEEDILKYANQHGYKITGLEKYKDVFVIGCWPNSQEKLGTLIESIEQVKRYGYPIVISTHYALPAPVVEMVDYVIYERKNVLSDGWTATYFRTNAQGQREEKPSTIPYHGVACLNAMRNAVDFCYGKYDRMHYLEYDCEVDYDRLLDSIGSKPMTCIGYEGKGIRTDVWSGDIAFLHRKLPVVSSWSDYTKNMKDINSEYVLENYLYRHFGAENIDIIKLDVGNRYDQVDRNLWGEDIFLPNYCDGPTLNITGISNREYDVTYSVGGKAVYGVKQKVGMWSKASVKYFLPWTITASVNGEEKFKTELNLAGKRVLISMGSKALGDSIAWIPYVEEFRKQHKCHIICSGWWQEIFDYPEIEFVKPGSEVTDIYAVYNVGCYDDQPNMNPKNWRECNLQQVASDILGIKFVPIKAKLKQVPSVERKPYICFSEFSTMKSKFWNYEGGWQEIVDYCNKLGYECVSISAEKTGLKNVTSHNGQSIQKTIEDMNGCAFYIGLNHGPAWIAYALDKPCIMITGITEEWNDFPNPYRIANNHDTCGIGCFNDPTLKIDRGFTWCPRGKNYACTAFITPSMVKEVIDKVEVEHACFNKEKGEQVSSADAKHGSRKGDNSGKGKGAGTVIERDRQRMET